MKEIMTIEKLAHKVAEELNAYVTEDNYENFAELKLSQWWDWSDIKSEINSIITEYANEEYKKGNFCDFYMYDDHTYVHIGSKDIPWREFKKMVFAEVK